eukprot:3055541-Prymnesium_polylepis.1
MEQTRGCTCTGRWARTAGYKGIRTGPAHAKDRGAPIQRRRGPSSKKAPTASLPRFDVRAVSVAHAARIAAEGAAAHVLVEHVDRAAQDRDRLDKLVLDVVRVEERVPHPIDPGEHNALLEERVDDVGGCEPATVQARDHAEEDEVVHGAECHP